MLIFSTRLLQLRVPNGILGRMTALETALYTLSEAGSSLFGGVALDVLALSLRQTLAGLTVAAGGAVLLWASLAAVQAGWWRAGYVGASEGASLH